MPATNPSEDPANIQQNIDKESHQIISLKSPIISEQNENEYTDRIWNGYFVA